MDPHRSLGMRKDNTYLSMCITHYMLLSGLHLYFWELTGYVLATDKANDLVHEFKKSGLKCMKIKITLYSPLTDIFP